MSFREDVRGGLFAGRDPLPQDVHTTLWERVSARE